jgi:drug/metabolite transporter (DMT)-like permease
MAKRRVASEPDGGPAPPSGHLKTLGMLAVLGVLWGTTFPVVRVGVESGASPFVLVAVDLLLAAAAMALVAFFLSAERPSARALLESLLLGALLIGGINLFLFWGVQFTTGGVASIVYATAPLLSVLAAIGLGGGERLRLASATALAIGFGGVVLLGLASSGTRLVTNGWGVVALFGGATSQAIGSVLVGRFRPSGETRYGQAAQFAGGGIAASILVVALRAPLVIPGTWAVTLSILYVALLTGVAGYTLYFELIRSAGAVEATLVTYLNPIVALAVGVFVLGEAFGYSELAGLALILGALALLHLSTARKRPQPVAPAPPTRALDRGAMNAVAPSRHP